MRILAFMEAHSVTGPAKNLIQFCQWTRSASTGLEVTLATTSRSPDVEGKNSGFVQAARQAGIPMHVMSERFRFDPGVIRQLRELADRTQADIVQTHNVKPHSLAKAAGFPKSRRWIAFHHGYTWTTPIMEVYNQVDRWSLRSAHRVVTVCQAFVPQLESRGVAREKIRVLHNSVTPPPLASAEDLAALRNQYGLSPETKLLLTIGRFSKEKGYADLVEALAQLKKDRAWKSMLVGDGPERAQVEQLVREKALTEQVIFTGFQSKTAPFFSLAKLFVLPSHSEGSPNVILEAMAAGVPVVATAVGGTPEVVSHEETALLVPDREPSALAAGVERLLSDEALQDRLRKAAKDRALTVFSPERYRANLQGIYREG
jgi:glycosyltransferase involved in cell wall biosynthesis